MVSRTTVAVLLLLCHVVAFVSAADRCSPYLQNCGSCVAQPDCGWCEWGGGSCMLGTENAPLNPAACRGVDAGQWYFGTCSDECFLACGHICSSSQTCYVTRVKGAAPACSCQEKPGVVAAIVVTSVASCCILLSIFVVIRRNRAMHYRKSMSAAMSDPFAGAYKPVLPTSQPALVCAALPSAAGSLQQQR